MVERKNKTKKKQKKKQKSPTLMPSRVETLNQSQNEMRARQDDMTPAVLHTSASGLPPRKGANAKGSCNLERAKCLTSQRPQRRSGPGSGGDPLVSPQWNRRKLIEEPRDWSIFAHPFPGPDWHPKQARSRALAAVIPGKFRIRYSTVRNKEHCW